MLARPEPGETLGTLSSYEMVEATRRAFLPFRSGLGYVGR
jgi:hypothetical protein